MTPDTTRELASHPAAAESAPVSDVVAAAVQAERERQDRYRRVLRAMAVDALAELRDLEHSVDAVRASLRAIVEGIDEQWMKAPNVAPNEPA